ncbi:metal-dependent hydrolase [Falsarthrobacter nasiphocae]|nr:metal-dependent hydrolase [Falsarthrobacter nasiphocae]
MMGGHHAASGAALWVGLTSTTLGAGLMPLDPAGVATGSLVCAGAALLPDLDHRRATLTRALPPISSVGARVVEAAAGGHRQGTHSLAGIAVAVIFAVLAGRTPWVPVLASLLLGSLAFTALKIVPGPKTGWLVGIAVALAVAAAGPGGEAWFPWAIGLGVAAHVLGDALTRGGVALLWPVSGRRFAVPVLGLTGSLREWLLMTPLSLYATVGLLLSAAQALGLWSGGGGL